MPLPTLLVAAAALIPGGEDVLTLRLAPDQDNTLFQSPGGTLSNGAGERLFAGLTNAGLLRRALLRFDLSTIPEGANITAVTLQLNVSKVPLFPPTTVFAMHRVSQDWGEGLSDAPGEEGTGAPSEPGDATWIHTSFPTELWSTPGGDFDPSSSAKATAGASLGPLTWSSHLLVKDVQAWVNGDAPNHGWLIKATQETVPANAKRFDSRELLGAPEDRPLLIIEYQLGIEPCAATVYCSDDPANQAEVSVDTCSCDGDSLNVILSGAPPGHFTLLLVGAGSAPIHDPPGAAGDLCLGGAPIGRFYLDGGQIDGAGGFSTDILGATSGGGGGAIPTLGGNFCSPPGQTWNFQYWHRGASPSGLSRALRVTFD